MNPKVKAAAIFLVTAAVVVAIFAVDGSISAFDLFFGVYVGAFLLYILIRTGFFAERVTMTLPGESAARKFKMRRSPGGKRFSASTEATFLDVAEAEQSEVEVKPGDRVIGLFRDGHAVAYPLAAMGLREVANERFETGDVSVTWWPVAYSARAFAPTDPAGELELGPSVHTVLNSSVLYDTEQNGYVQFTGDCVTGPGTGSSLQQIPVLLTTWAAWRSAHPDTEVMSKEGTPEFDVFERYYSNNRPGLYSQRTRDRRLADKDVIFGLRVGGESMAWPFKSLIERPMVRQSVGGHEVLVVHERLSSTAAAFRPVAADRALTFESLTGNPARPADPGVEVTYEPWLLKDAETGSTWRAITGECIDGDLRGHWLEMLPGDTGFWFAWSRFHPTTSLFDVQSAEPSLSGVA